MRADKSPSDFYVYSHIRASDGTVFYVGKGRGGRAYDFRKRNKKWQAMADRHDVEVRLIREGLSEEDAFSLERETIRHFGKANLANMTDGGEGLSGLIFSESHKAKIGAAHRGRKKPEWLIERLRLINTGRKLSDEHRAKLSSSGKGRQKTPEHIAKVARSRIGKSHSEIGKLNIRVAKSKIVVCVETGEEFFGARHAVEWLLPANPKASQAAISRACLKASKVAYGFHWRYK